MSKVDIIFVDTGLLRGKVWSHDPYNESCNKFIQSHPMKSHSYCYCHPVREEAMHFVKKMQALPLDNLGKRQVKNMRRVLREYFEAMEQVDFKDDEEFARLCDTLHTIMHEGNPTGKEPNQSHDAEIVASAIFCHKNMEKDVSLVTVDARDIKENEREFVKEAEKKDGKMFMIVLLE